MSALCLAVSVSHAPRFALMSSRMAAWGQPPVSIARILQFEEGTHKKQKYTYVLHTMGVIGAWKHVGNQRQKSKWTLSFALHSV